MTYEKALVILLSRLQFNELMKTRIFHIIKNGVDWYDFLNYCIKTNTVCLAYKNLVKLGIERLLPSTIKYNMRYHYEQNTIRNQYLMASLERIMQNMEERGIAIAPVKGAKFLYTIYKEDPGVRLLNDIDILAGASARDSIYEYMNENNFGSYLINDEDAFCFKHTNEDSHFYISFTEVGLHDDLRIDFDYSYSASFINTIRENNCFYEFCYLCKSYYSAMKKKGLPDTVDQFDYIKLIDIYEYYKAYLACTTTTELKSEASVLQFSDELNYVLACFKRVELQILTS